MEKLKFWVLISFLATILIKIPFVLLTGKYFSGFDVPKEFYVTNVINVITAIFGIPVLLMWAAGRLEKYNKQLLYCTISGLILYALLAESMRYNFNSIMNGMSAALTPFALFIPSKLLYEHIIAVRKKEAKIYPFSTTINELLLFAGLYVVLAEGTTSALAVCSLIYPNTIDFDLYRIDLAFSGFAEHIAIWFDLHNYSALISTIIAESYNILAFFIYLMWALAIRENKDGIVNATRTLIIPFGVAFVLYAINSASGPVFAFTAINYPHFVNIDNIPQGAQYILPSARNAMPSMHLTGAIIIVLISACLQRKIYFYASILFLIVTFVATLALGQHYLIDLIVAMPFAVAIGTALLNPPKWQFWKRRLWWLCVSLFVLWEILLLIARNLLIEHVIITQILSAISVLAALACFGSFLKIAWNLPVQTQQNSINTSKVVKATFSLRWVFLLFISSGFAGLLYQVVFAKSLGVTFGGTSLAAYTVMATYMGGMAIGAWLGGIIADRVRLPLRWYAIFEGFIGIYALATPMLFNLIEKIYSNWALDIRPDAAILTFWRVALGAIVLGIPTILMGTTLPIMFKYLRTYLQNSGVVISNLYTANVLGAAFGALVGGYLVLPSFGINGSTYLAAMISLLIALYALSRMKKNENHQISDVDETTIATATIPEHCSQDKELQRRLGLMALIIVTVGGMVTLALEVVNMHMLATIAGNSVYAFGLMLATFLLGLGLGALFFSRLQRYLNAPLITVVAQLGIFFSIIICAFQWDNLANYFASFAPIQVYIYEGMTFATRELIRAAVCAIVMVPPAFFIGLGYPATMELATDWLKKNDSSEASGLGIASLCNTGGNIIGVLLTGFLLLNTLGSNRMMLLLAVISLLLALLMFVFSYRIYKHVFPAKLGKLIIGGTAMAIATLLFVYPNNWNINAITSGSNVYFSAGGWGTAIDYSESIEGGITSISKSGDNQLTLLTNGKFQGNNTGEVEAQESIALIPLLHEPKRDKVLVIGYGTGVSAHVLHQHNFKHLDIAELSKDIVVMADRHFADINKLVSQQDNVDVFYTDGRNYLLTQNKSYDLISMEISSIWFAGAANLYNAEFYELAHKRLGNTGTLQQWVQLHHIHTIDLLYILNTVNHQFKHVWLYVKGGQGIIVASDNDAVVNDIYNLKGEKIESKQQLNPQELELLNAQLLNPEDMDYISAKIDRFGKLVSNDDNLYLEYATPKGNAIIDDAFSRNIKELLRFKEERLKAQEKHDN